MMLDVVRYGTGTAAALPGVDVAGKTGTAELRPNSSDPKDADAWFVAFAPADGRGRGRGDARRRRLRRHRRGAGGREVLSAAL